MKNKHNEPQEESRKVNTGMWQKQLINLSSVIDSILKLTEQMHQPPWKFIVMR